MQFIEFKNKNLTVEQRFFILKSLELLHSNTIDSYRVKVRNPKSIMVEIKECIEGFERGQIKHFLTIAGEKDKLSLSNEAENMINTEPDYLRFTAISKEYYRTLLRTLSEKSYIKTKKSLELLIEDNADYVENIIDGLRQLLYHEEVQDIFPKLKKIDTTIGILFSELVDAGFSKNFLYRYIRSIFTNSLTDEVTFQVKFEEFINRLSKAENKYEVVFRIDTSKIVYETLKVAAQDRMTVMENVDEYKIEESKEFEIFNQAKEQRVFVKCEMQAPDYLTALKLAKSILAENLDIINLGFSDEFIHVHQRVFVVDTNSPKNAKFQSARNSLDGKYNVTKEHYLGFIEKLPAILSKDNISPESKEKVKSAVRYLRLGNQSVEVEHKFINYWIGLEYLFSNYDNYNTINRIKDHFIKAHLLIYVKRNLNAFDKSFKKLPALETAKIQAYTGDTYLQNPDFYEQIGTLLINTHPLLAYRALKLKEWIFKSGGGFCISDYLKRHEANLHIHLTRIYRLRNEIIHDAATDTNYEQIASNLRYYLTFMLNSIIDHLYTTKTTNASIEEFFTLNELYYENLKQKGFPLNEMLNVKSSIDFIS